MPLEVPDRRTSKPDLGFRVGALTLPIAAFFKLHFAFDFRPASIDASPPHG